MGYGAVKYADLKNNRQTNYKCATALLRTAATCTTCWLQNICHAWAGRHVRTPFQYWRTFGVYAMH